MVAVGVGSMDQSEVMDFIKNSPEGVLTLVDGDKPCGVPLEHHFGGKTLHFLNSQQKAEKSDASRTMPMRVTLYMSPGVKNLRKLPHVSHYGRSGDFGQY